MLLIHLWFSQLTKNQDEESVERNNPEDVLLQNKDKTTVFELELYLIKKNKYKNQTFKLTRNTREPSSPSI